MTHRREIAAGVDAWPGGLGGHRVDADEARRLELQAERGDERDLPLRRAGEEDVAADGLPLELDGLELAGLSGEPVDAPLSRPALPAMALVEPLHGFTFALLHLSCMLMIARVVPEQLYATTQAFYVTVAVGAAARGSLTQRSWKMK